MERCRVSDTLSIAGLPALRKCSVEGETAQSVNRCKSLELRDLPTLEVSAETVTSSAMHGRLDFLHFTSASVAMMPA